MLRLYTLFLVFSFSVAAEIIDIDVYFNQLDNKLLDQINVVARKVNADNQFVSANVGENDCLSSYVDELCPEKGSSDVYLVISDRSGVLRQKTVKKLETGENTSDEVVRALTDFSETLFTARIEEIDDVNWFEGGLSEEANSRLIGSRGDLKNFISNDKGAVLYFKPDDFLNYEAVVHSTEAAKEGHANLKLVDCSKITCISEISSPVLYYYKDGKRYQQYDDIYDKQTITTWLIRLKQSVMALLTEDIVPMYRGGIVPGFNGVQDTVIMLFVTSKQHDVYKNYYRFAKQNQGKYHLTAVVKKEISQWANNPAFITMKPLEQYQKAFVLFKDVSYNSMAKFIAESVHPSHIQLKSAALTIEAFSRSTPLLILFDVCKQKDETEFLKTASEHEVRSELTAFALNRGLNLFGLYLHKMLGLDTLEPTYILINTDRTCAYTKKIGNETHEQIKFWAQKVLEFEKCDTDITYDKESLEKLDLWYRRMELNRSREDKKETTTAEETHDEL